MKKKDLIEKLERLEEKLEGLEEVVDKKNRRTAELEAKIKEQEELISNPNLQTERLIKKIICEHLQLKSYSSNSVELFFDEECLGSVDI